MELYKPPTVRLWELIYKYKFDAFSYFQGLLHTQLFFNITKIMLKRVYARICFMDALYYEGQKRNVSKTTCNASVLNILRVA